MCDTALDRAAARRSSASSPTHESSSGRPASASACQAARRSAAPTAGGGPRARAASRRSVGPPAHAHGPGARSAGGRPGQQRVDARADERDRGQSGRAVGAPDRDRALRGEPPERGDAGGGPTISARSGSACAHQARPTRAAWPGSGPRRASRRPSASSSRSARARQLEHVEVGAHARPTCLRQTDSSPDTEPKWAATRRLPRGTITAPAWQRSSASIGMRATLTVSARPPRLPIGRTRPVRRRGSGAHPA